MPPEMRSDILDTIADIMRNLRNGRIPISQKTNALQWAIKQIEILKDSTSEHETRAAVKESVYEELASKDPGGGIP